MLTEPLQESLVDQVRQIIELKTGCDARGRCGADCPCESAARAALSVAIPEIVRHEQERCVNDARAALNSYGRWNDSITPSKLMGLIEARIRARGGE